MSHTKPVDEVASALAAFCYTAPEKLPPAAIEGGRLVLLDSLAVSLNALDHPAAHAVRRYAKLYGNGDSATVWGTRMRVGPEVATLVNGVPLRAYDYNDLYIGLGSGGHPSDIVPGLIATAERAGRSGSELLRALAIGYEITLHLFDTMPTAKRGWDYVNLTAIGATCGIGILMGLTEAQLREALAITVIAHGASNEIESGELNERGDLTMWKRFNGADAVRHALYACQLASVSVEGAVRPFVGRHGFINLIAGVVDAIPELLWRLREPQLSRVSETTFKRWPVGSRAQSAIQAALSASLEIADISAIERVDVYTGENVYDHLVHSRVTPWQPNSRETADHSLPYIVASAVLDGQINSGSFAQDKLDCPHRRMFLKDKVAVHVEPELNPATPGEFLSRIEIRLVNGKVISSPAKLPPGHPKNPFTREDMLTKVREIAGSVHGYARVEDLITAVLTLEDAPDVAALSTALVGDFHS